MSQKLIAAGILLTSMIAAGCGGTAEQDAQPGAGYRLRVFRAGQPVAQLTLADLQQMGPISLVLEGTKQEGPPLVEVLAKVGITDFTAVSVVGKSQGRLVSRELHLRRDQLTAQTILDFNKRGNTKLVSPALPSEQWVIDVSELVVE